MSADILTLNEGENVVFLSSSEEKLSSQLIEEFSRKVGSSGKVTALPVNSATSANKVTSGYDSCVIGFDFPSPISENVLSYALKLLKPGGNLWILEATVDVENENGRLLTKDRLQSKLKLNGFVNVEFKENVKNLNLEIQDGVKQKLNIKSAVNFSLFSSRKPNYEIGASAPLKLNASAPKNLTPAQQVWTLSADDLDDYGDDDLLDSDEVLDEADLLKPDPASLRATCGDASAKKKACKNCTCGLAEELAAEKIQKELEGIDPGQKKSSCGSCYLGDAFRCAGCPYRGLPAFKPGENAPLQ